MLGGRAGCFVLQYWESNLDPPTCWEEDVLPLTRILSPTVVVGVLNQTLLETFVSWEPYLKFKSKQTKPSWLNCCRDVSHVEPIFQSVESRQRHTVVPQLKHWHTLHGPARPQDMGAGMVRARAQGVSIPGS